ncbi:cytidylyltransferase domain-containing protein [Halomicrobium salinisoli]|uniref:acylneuraminate cytidylyltransferase family protein n=1 Tax=Halomicrobium salinisoli TaxID=2878391 RepID=UPI001CF03E08|nr:acylneuraminate cytidylyltransferase family protein [Halomicrobium salinisoli]
MAPRTLGVIPARGGSQRVPDKNVRNVGGDPLVAYTIEQATESAEIDEAVVTTESDEIKRVAEEYGGTVIDRPPELATDTAPVSDAITHAVESYGGEFDILCMLQVTSPLRSTADIDGAIRRFAKSDAESLVSTTQYTQEPQLALTEDDDGRLRERYEPSVLFTDEYVRGQDLEDLQFPNGAMFVVDTDVWLEREAFYTGDTIGYEMPPKRSLQIDEPWELDVVDAILHHQS